MDRRQLQAFYPMTLAVRRLFHKLAYGIAALHRDEEISVGMRAVLESVIDGGPQTVPHMARVRPVTRQHIQGLVNGLMEAGLVEAVDNPAHKRSRLIRATESGAALFERMRRRESEALGEVEIDADPAAMEAATALLRQLIATFESPEWQAIVDRHAETRETDDDDD